MLSNFNLISGLKSENCVQGLDVCEKVKSNFEVRTRARKRERDERKTRSSNMTALKPDCVEQSRFDFVLEKKCVKALCSNRDSFNAEWHDLTHSRLIALVKP